jgi:hypothetical protein
MLQDRRPAAKTITYSGTAHAHQRNLHVAPAKRRAPRWPTRTATRGAPCYTCLRRATLPPALGLPGELWSIVAALGELRLTMRGGPGGATPW